MMTSDPGKQKRGYLAKKARNARLRRLEIQELHKSYTRKSSEFGGSFPCPGCRNNNFENVASTEGPADGVKDTEVKGIAGNMGSWVTFANLNSSNSLDHNSGDYAAQSKGKGQRENEESVSEKKLVTTLNCGSVSLIGRRRTMEDAVTVAPGDVGGRDYSFFAAYDGHGGERVANTCSERLHKLLETEIQLEGRSESPTRVEQTSDGADGSGNVDWKKVMAACFSKMDDEVRKDEQAEEAVGSTALVVIVGKEEFVVANCGDSRVVLCRSGVAMPLSDDHKPERPDERERVEAAGGRIIDWNGNRVQGVLSTSRSIGDHYLRPFVISEPEVTLTRRTESDEFLIIATDGLWDVVSNEFASEVVRRCLGGGIRRRSSTELAAVQAAALLAEVAVAKGSRDNISVIVVELKNKF